jgi:hypothetical protein
MLQDAEQSIDRIDAMRVFVAARDEGSLTGAGRKLGRSPAAVSRAAAFLKRPCWCPASPSHDALGPLQRFDPGARVTCRAAQTIAHRLRL